MSPKNPYKKNTLRDKKGQPDWVPQEGHSTSETSNETKLFFDVLSWLAKAYVIK